MGSHRVAHDWSNLAAAAAAWVLIFELRENDSTEPWYFWHLVFTLFKYYSGFYGEINFLDCQPACLLSCLGCVWLFVTLWTVAHQAPLSMGFSRQEYWSELPYPPLGNLPYPRIKPTSPASSISQADFLPLNHQGRPSSNIKEYKEVSMRLPWWSSD